jgi:ParB-like chromosome segregation protein Spo0J
MSDIKIHAGGKSVLANPRDLRPYERNSKTHSDEQIDLIRQSFRQYGFTVPIIVDEEWMILAGHARQKAAIMEDMPAVPIVVLTGLTEAQKRAYVIADNKMTERGGWDNDLLKIELEFLQGEGFDLDLTGLTVDEMGDILVDGDGEHASDEDEDDDPEEPNDVCPHCGGALSVKLVTKH